MKRVIINGDDYGYTSEKNEGILKSHKEGILTSTTVMTNIISKEAIDKILQHKNSLGIGLHLNLTKGKPISSPEEVPTLLNEDKEMFRPTIWERKAWDDFGDSKSIAEVELEFNKQLKRFRDILNIEPSHIDSHHFITSHKKIFPVMIKIAKENDLPIRLPAWIRKEDKYELEAELVKKAKEQCKTTDYCILDFFCINKDPLEELIKSLRNLQQGTTEFMFHPSTFKQGVIDMELLTNETIKKVIKEEAIELITYKEL